MSQCGKFRLWIGSLLVGSVGWLGAALSSDVYGDSEHQKMYRYRIEFATFLGGSEW